MMDTSKVKLPPVYFGTALGNFTVKEMLDDFVKWAPMPQSRQTESRIVSAEEEEFSGFVFKIKRIWIPIIATA